MDLMVSGRLMSMDEAASIGLVTEVWDAARLAGRPFVDAVLEYAGQFVPPHRASLAVGRIKRAVQSGSEAGFGEGLALERELQQLLFESDDAKEGIAASLEKRKPTFTGS
jgi:enoyl-CoA hydratase